MHLMHHQSASDLDQARRCLLEAGEVPSGLVDDTLARSWQRSRHAGLSPAEAPSAAPVCSEGELREAIGSHQDFLAHARPVMDFVFDQIKDSGNLVVLSDSRGLLLHSLGDAEFISRADRVALRPGALWHEADRGTNAIGTALAESRPVVIHGAEHYLERNSFLTCAAAPVTGPNGRLRGVIDISGDHRTHHPHTFAMVRSAARMIEDRLFHARHGRDRVLRLHPRPEGLGGVGEGLLALSEDGWVVGANAMARHWLAVDDRLIGACTLEQLTGHGLNHWRSGKMLPLRAAGGALLQARLDPSQRGVLNMPMPAQGARERVQGHVMADAPFAPPEPATHKQATHQQATHSQAATRPALNGLLQQPGMLDELNATPIDARLFEARRRARRVQEQGIAVLIQGESGSGKEVFARHLHGDGKRSHKPFVAVNCAALPETLIEAELFGYVGGAFTGARREGSPGRIREADGGTLFLDEIGDMPLSLQARLLRVLQDKVVMPLGGSKPVPVDFLLVCATHRRLKDMIAAGAFREDLYYRVNGLTVTLPALRERQDFHAVLREVLDHITQGMGRARIDTVHPGLLQALAAYPWPGNLRQLHALMRTACALLEPDETALDWPHLPEDMSAELQSPTWQAHGQGDVQAHAHSQPRGSVQTPHTMPPLAPESGLNTAHPAEANLRKLSLQTIHQVIQATGGNMSEAARKLGISRNTLYRRLKADS
jgi:sigma-54 dependent transcriptional regulator, acetoin dehydrogenase operon transcriptional activator AcoR